MTAPGHRILLVDEPADGGAGELLEGGGFQVVSVDGASLAEEALARAPVDLCVIWAAGADTAFACRLIRSGPRGAVVPLIVVGGAGTDVGSRPLALEIGADSFLEREEVEDGLPARVRTLLGLDAPGDIDSLERALAAAEVVVPAESCVQPSEEEASVAVGTASVLEVIEQVQRRLGGAPAVGEAPPAEWPDGAPADGEVLADEEVDTLVTLVGSGVGEPAEGTPPDAPLVAEDAGTPAESMPEDGSGRGRPWRALAASLAARRDGALVLRRRAVERRLFLERGEVVMAVSSAREDRLVELLYREGRLTDEQYQQAVMTVGASGRRVGAVLVERGFIASRELFPLVRHHYETLVYDSFSWRDCDWHFEDGARQTGERILLDVPTAALIVEGIRSRAGREDVDALIPHGSRPCLLERGIAPLEDVGLPAEELQILDLCDGSLSTSRISGRVGLPEEELRALLAGLAVLGWVRAEGGGATPDDPDAKPRRHSRIAVEAGLQVERARVGEKLGAVEEGSYFALLEVPPDASGHEIRKAYRRLRSQFAPERFAVEELADLRGQAEVIRIVLDEAYEVLRDPVVREAYREARHAPSAEEVV